MAARRRISWFLVPTFVALAAGCSQDGGGASGGSVADGTAGGGGDALADGAIHVKDAASAVDASQTDGAGTVDGIGGQAGAPHVVLTLVGAEAGCRIAAEDAPAVGTEITFAFARNGGAFVALPPSDALFAPLPAEVVGCDVVQCRARFATDVGSVEGYGGPAQVPMGDACGAGCWSCAVGGGCKTATDDCDDGDACTTGDSCGADGCKGAPVAAETWYVDADGDGFGGVLFAGNSCGVPDAIARAATTFST